MFINPEKNNLLNTNNLIAEIQKKKKMIEKETGLSNSKKAIAFTKNGS